MADKTTASRRKPSPLGVKAFALLDRRAHLCGRHTSRAQVRPDTANAADGIDVSPRAVPLTALGSGDTGNITLGLPCNGTANGCEDGR
ncbi:conserved hypothethical protein (plasmid) [Ralstonia solanacearum CMR15]|nr:conserved hypothethical protein [Ralstonia solanacearum CMR15]